jgi:hypothetical protein
VNLRLVTLQPGHERESLPTQPAGEQLFVGVDGHFVVLDVALVDEQLATLVATMLKVKVVLGKVSLLTLKDLSSCE